MCRRSQRSEYARICLDRVLNISQVLIWQYCEYGRVLNMQELHKVLNMPQYGLIYLNRMWVSLNMSEFTMIDRVLSISYTMYSKRSLYKLMSTY